MATSDSDETKPLGFSIDIGEILKEVASSGTSRRTTRPRTRASTTDMDAALRRAVRAELVDVERALKLVAAEIVRLRRGERSPRGQGRQADSPLSDPIATFAAPVTVLHDRWRPTR